MRAAQASVLAFVLASTPRAGRSGIDNSSIFAFIIHPSRTLSAQQQRRGPMLVSLFAFSSYYSGGGNRDQYDNVNMPTIDKINLNINVKHIWPHCLSMKLLHHN